MHLAPLLAALALTGQGYRDRFPLPDPAGTEGWGVNIHFTDPQPGEMEMIRDAGFKWVRMDLTWSAVERTRGKYDFRAYDRLMGHLERNGIRLLAILCYGNDLYEQGAPRSAEARRAFARFAGEAVERYKGRGVVWELWNEPNNPRFWHPRPDVDEYAALARDVGRALRRAAPEEWFVGPGTSRVDWEFLGGCLDAGLLDVFDALTVHPYRLEAPETVLPDWHRLRRMIAARTSRDVPLLSGEWGYSARYPGQSVATQAHYAVRQYLANLAGGVGMSIWYDWRNDGTDPNEPEHHFGTVDPQMRPKAAYTAIRDAARRLRGHTFSRMLPSPPGSIRYLFAGPAPCVAEVVGGIPRMRDATADEARVLDLPVPPTLVTADGPVGVGAVLAATRRSLGRSGELAASIDGRPVGGDEAIAAALGRSAQPRRVSLDWILEGARLPLYEGIWSHARPLELALKPSGAGERLVVTIDAQGPPAPERLTVELRIGSRVLTDVVRVDRGGAVARFPWYPWEARSDLQVRVLDADRAELASLGTMIVTPVPLGDGRGLTLIPEGDPTVSGTVSHRLEAAPPGGPTREALRIDYRFAPGWKYAALTDPGASPLPGTPETYTVWVHGDGSGDALRMRFVDATGQTFQVDLATMNFRGWRELQCSLLGDRAGRWGGANDGVVHLPIRITVPALIDGASRRGTSGAFYLAEAHVLGR